MGAAGVGFQPGVGQVVLAGGDHEHIGSGIELAETEVVVHAAAVVSGEAEIGWSDGPALAYHHQIQLLQRRAGDLDAEARNMYIF